MSSTVLRPGLELGPYPERETAHRSKLERTIIAAAHAITRRSLPHPANYRRVIRSINRRGVVLDRLSDVELQERTRELRHRLRQSGLSSDPLLIDAFALVREAAHRTLQMRHFDVQLAGGWAMLRGMIAEMETGEGKTLTATLPACTAALAGIPVHIITVNDYLAQRDAAWMGKIYATLWPYELRHVPQGGESPAGGGAWPVSIAARRCLDALFRRRLEQH